MMKLRLYLKIKEGHRQTDTPLKAILNTDYPPFKAIFFLVSPFVIQYIFLKFTFSLIHISSNRA